MTNPIPHETLEVITLETLLARVTTYRKEGYRLVAISATRLPDQVELTYSFDLDTRLASVRITIPAAAATLPSISGIYGAAVLYENEIHDLFNVQVTAMALDFHGTLYKTAIPFPFGSAPASCAKPAAAAAPPATPAK